MFISLFDCCYISLYEVSGDAGGMPPSESLTVPHVAFWHVQMLTSTAGGKVWQRRSNVTSLKQRCFMIMKGNVLDKTSALLSSYIVVFAFI